MPSIIDEARSEILIAMSVLMSRRANTPDPDEKQVITSSLKELNTQLERLEQAELLEAAVAVSNAADEIEKVIGGARLGPFDNYLTRINAVLNRLGQISGDMHVRDSLPKADFPAGIAPGAKAVAAGDPALGGPITKAPPAVELALSSSAEFSKISDEYAKLYKDCQITPNRMGNVEFYVSRLVKFKATYANVATELNGIPWQFVGIVHGMEGGFDFSRHLHNGDSLEGRTVQVPKGRPISGTPPFKWHDSAIDALMLKGLHHVTNWSRERLLFELERFNGFGYRTRGLPSPYLWSFTNHYVKGKYVRDHDFDPEAVSKQCGAAAILMGLESAGKGLN